jgi:hypothetical protein
MPVGPITLCFGCLPDKCCCFFIMFLQEEEHPLNKPLSVEMTANEFEVQTAPLGDGILPGIMRQIVIE